MLSKGRINFWLTPFLHQYLLINWEGNQTFTGFLLPLKIKSNDIKFLIRMDE